MKTLDQQRAAHAWAVVQGVANLPEDRKSQKREFGTQAKKLPTRILASGLGQALAFLRAKKYAPELVQALDDWLALRRPVPQGQPRFLVERIIQADSEFLRYATGECLAYLQWLVRFADALDLTEGSEG